MGFSNAILTDAQVDVIAWNETSAGWLEFEHGQQLGDRMHAISGISTRTKAIAQATTIGCTKQRTAPQVATLEVQISVPNYDPISAIVWESLVLP
ncbi:MAG: hypothetical protein ACTS2F_27240 [Thainema sp.]